MAELRLLNTQQQPEGTSSKLRASGPACVAETPSSSLGEEGCGGEEQQEEEYLHVVAVLARQLQGQLTSGPGTAIPQPADFRGQLRVLDTEARGEGWDGAGSPSATRGGEREGEGERRKRRGKMKLE